MTALLRRESTEPLDLVTGENLAAGSLGRLVDALGAIAWLDSLGSLEPVAVTHTDAERALAGARDEKWGDG